MWTFGYIVPVHTKKLFQKYQCSLGLNTMQGREAKHQRLAAYSKNTTVKNKWQQIFRHKYMTLIWLREQNPFQDNYSKTQFKYVPLRCSTHSYCHCGLSKESDSENCTICSSDVTKYIINSVEKEKICT